MTLRTDRRGQFLPVFLAVLVVVLIVIAVLYLMNRHRQRSEANARPHVAAIPHSPMVKKSPRKPKPKPVESTGGAVASKDDGFSIEGPAKQRTIVHRVLPEYPESVQEQGIEGTVVLRFEIKDDGAVRSTVVLEHSSMSQTLDDAAEEALLQWKFSEGPAVPGYNLITFRFSLDAAR